MQQIGAVPSFTGSVTLPPIEPPTPLSPGKSDREAFHAAKVRLAYTAADVGAVDTFDQFYDPHFHGFESGGTSIEGVEAMRDRVRAFTDAVPDRKITVLETVAEGTLVATHITMSGEFDRPLVQASGMTIQPTGAAMNIAGVEFYAFDQHGMILKSWPEFDVMDFLQQIGVI
jgi:predicted ester cyclase